MDEGEVIASLRRALSQSPDDVALRLHLAEMLLERGDATEAVREVAAALSREPASVAARDLMARAMGASGSREAESVGGGDAPASSAGSDGAVTSGAAFDWQQAEREVGGLVPPMFVAGESGGSDAAFDVELSSVRLDDVGGMEEAKARLEAAFLAPLRNPELQRLYRKQLRGGLLLFGPPGCGKTFLARAIAGELQARFISVSLADVLDMWLGASERNLHEVFALARRNAPCVLFLDEVDALGQKRTSLRHSAMRTTVNQLLEELDGAGSNNDGLFVLAATNQPWDVDPALRRPGRFDRSLLVLPPDEEARHAILTTHLRQRPVAGIDVAAIARRTEGFSGADLAHLCDTAAEKALVASARDGVARMIEMRDLQDALAEVRASTGAWFDSARNVAMFSNEHGEYDGILQYLRRKRRS